MIIYKISFHKVLNNIVSVTIWEQEEPKHRNYLSEQIAVL